MNREMAAIARLCLDLFKLKTHGQWATFPKCNPTFHPVLFASSSSREPSFLRAFV